MPDFCDGLGQGNDTRPSDWCSVGRADQQEIWETNLVASFLVKSFNSRIILFKSLNYSEGINVIDLCKFD